MKVIKTHTECNGSSYSLIKDSRIRGGVMEYYKLIALSICDLSSSIFFEDNYGMKEFTDARVLKSELESKGYTCLLAKTSTTIKVK